MPRVKLGGEQAKGGDHRQIETIRAPLTNLRRSPIVERSDRRIIARIELDDAGVFVNESPVCNRPAGRACARSSRNSPAGSRRTSHQVSRRLPKPRIARDSRHDRCYTICPRPALIGKGIEGKAAGRSFEPRRSTSASAFVGLDQAPARPGFRECCLRSARRGSCRRCHRAGASRSRSRS